MRIETVVAGALMLVAGSAIAAPTGAHLLRDNRGKVVGAAGVGTPCDPGDDQCVPYSLTGVVTTVDRDRDGAPASFALRLSTGDIQLQTFKDDQLGLDSRDRRDLGRWLKPGLRVTVSGSGAGTSESSLVDRVAQAPDESAGR